MKSTENILLVIISTVCFACFTPTRAADISTHVTDDSPKPFEIAEEDGVPLHDSKELQEIPFKDDTRVLSDSKSQLNGFDTSHEIEFQSSDMQKDLKRSIRSKYTAFIEAHPTRKTVERPKRALKSEGNLEQVTIEVERLFDSLSKRRSEVEHPRRNTENENEITVVIENDGEDDHEEQSSSAKRSDIPEYDGSGFAIILDNTNGNNGASTPQSTVEDFSKMSRSYDSMKARFDKFLSEEKTNIPRASPYISSGSHSNVGGSRQSKSEIFNPSKPTERNMNTVRSTIEADIEKLKKLRERLQLESAAIDAQDDRTSVGFRSRMKENGTNGGSVGLSGSRTNMAQETRREKISAAAVKIDDQAEGNLTNTRTFHPNYYEKKSSLDESDEKNSSKATEKSTSSNSTPTKTRENASRGISLRPSRRYYPTHKVATTLASTTPKDAINNTSNVSKSPKRIIYPRKASAMIEYLNKDPLESWFYKFQSLPALGLNSTMLRNGLVNPGSIDRLKNVMVRALKGSDITLSVVGGSISAGGGLYKDEGNIGGLYYKGVVDWWNKVITPLTGSEMKVNNIAIGSIGTDYFSYCLRSHISNDSNIVIWELSGNDYNRYLKTPTKGAKPLERFTRMALQVPSGPAILFVNFFKGVDYKKSKKDCPDFEDQGEDIIAHYYKIPSLSWRAMVCESLIQQNPLFTLKSLFCKDQYHPSLLSHAQTALLLILHLRHVMRSVLQYASSHDGILPDFNSFYNMPAPLFVGLEHPVPLCWTLISPDFKEPLSNNLEVKILNQNGFKIEYATNFPIRFDRVVCWRAEKVDAFMKIQITLPEGDNKEGPVDERTKDLKYEIAITTHTRFGGSAEVWLDQRSGQPMVIREGRPNDTGKRTQVDVITQNAEPGVHTLNFKAISTGFCLASVMVS